MLLLPRLIRLKDAPNYLGMDRHRFNADVRPYIAEIRLGKQGIAFDRDDLDNWVNALKQQIAENRVNANTTRLLNSVSHAKKPKLFNQHRLTYAKSTQYFEQLLKKLGLKQNRQSKQNKEKPND